MKEKLRIEYCVLLMTFSFSSSSAPTKIEELTAGSDEKTQLISSIFVRAERERISLGIIPTRASFQCVLLQ